MKLNSVSQLLRPSEWTKNMFPEFIRFAKGTLAFGAGILLYAPLLAAWKMQLYPNWKVKQKLFSYFFKGMRLADFNHLCTIFFQQSKHLIRTTAIHAINDHLANGDWVIIISAGIENWIQPFANELTVPAVFCTQLEIDANECLTGCFASANCYSEEKVRRLLQHYPQRDSYYLVAYGDSRGDKELLDFADKRCYKTL
jgi:HAD superfamily phosphoserine phosphatase-like hydrolase